MQKHHSVSRQSPYKYTLSKSSIENFFDQVIVIKYGGNAMTEEKLQKDFAQDISYLQSVGIKPIVIHGGGPQISTALKRLSIPEKFLNGIRVTDLPTMQVVEWVLCGEVQQNLVRLINLAFQEHKSHMTAIGLSGNDAQLITAKKINTRNIDLAEFSVGQVGEVISVNTSIIEILQSHNIIPIISSVASDSDGSPLNINADTLASAIACALKAKRLVTMTNISGVLDENKNLVPLLTPEIAKNLQLHNALSGGILPKIQSALDAANNGVNAVHIIDGRESHALLKSLDATQIFGTLVRTSI